MSTGIPAPCGVHTITLDCVADCLRAVVSGGAVNPLARGGGAPFSPPGTVGDVAGLYRQGRLGGIPGLGPRRIGEIGAGLVFAGLVIAASRSA